MRRAVVFRGVLWGVCLLLLFSSSCAMLSNDSPAASASSAGEAPTLAASPLAPEAQARSARPTMQASPSPSAPLRDLSASTPTRISALPASGTATAPVEPQEINSHALLALDFDVLYLRQGGLHRWSHVTRQVETLFGPSVPGLGGALKAESTLFPGEVVDFATDRLQRRVVVLVDRGISANGVGLYDLVLLDLARGAARQLQGEVRRLDRLALSPDGSRVAYSDALSRQIYLLSLEQGPSPQELATCQSDNPGACTPTWSVSGKFLAWADAQGIWQASAPDWQASLASPLTISMLDIDGSPREVQVHAGRVSWSPFDRYLLAEVSPHTGQQYWLAVVDMRTGMADEIPGPTFSADSRAPAAWLPDGSLITLHVQPASNGTVQVNLWQVFPTRKPMPMLQRRLELRMEAAGFADLQMIANRYLLFRAQDENNLKGWLARLDLDFGQLNWILPVPGGARQAVWAPDGSGVFVAVEPDISVYASAGGARLTDLRDWFGDELSNLTWCLATGKTGTGGDE